MDRKGGTGLGAIGRCAASVPDDRGEKRVVVQGWAVGRTGKVVPGEKVRPGSTWQTGPGAADAGNSGWKGDGLGVRQGKVRAEVVRACRSREIRSLPRNGDDSCLQRLHFR
jgi:hypothetical protein